MDLTAKASRLLSFAHRIWNGRKIGFQFHAAISLTLLVVAGVLAAIEATRYPQPHMVLIAAGLLAPIMLRCIRALREFREIRTRPNKRQGA